MRPLFSTFSILLFILVMGSGCTIEVANNSTSDVITEEDLQAARQIIGKSLSTDNSGVVLSINDALNIISQNNTSSSNPRVQQKDRSGSGSENNYQTTYNPDTGIFTVSFQRMVEDPLFSKTVGNELRYLYRDSENQIIETPDENSSEITSISYIANREGEIQTLQNETTFIRKDSLFVSGFDDSPGKTIEGTQTSTGSIVINHPDETTIERFYELQFNFLNITFEKNLSALSMVVLAITGNMSFRLKLWQSANKTENPTVIDGIIKNSGDGTAILKFSGIAKSYILNLKTGDPKNLDEEFEGQIIEVDIAKKQVTFVNGLSAYVTEDTEYSAFEFPSLQSIQTNLSDGKPVWAEAIGAVEDRNFIVEALFLESRDGTMVDTDAPIEFREVVTLVNSDVRIFILQDQVEVQLFDTVTVRTDGDYHSLDEVTSALNQNTTVIAEGEARTRAPNAMLAFEVKFLDGANRN